MGIVIRRPIFDFSISVLISTSPIYFYCNIDVATVYDLPP